MEGKKIFEDFNKVATDKYIKNFMFIKGFATSLNLEQTMIALSVARIMHEGQFRRDGNPYFSHPLKVCSTLIGHGIKDDAILAAALLHDVIEDCQDKLPLEGRELTLEYGISYEVFEIVQLLTKKSGATEDELNDYFNKIKHNPKALLVKLSDRLHNSQTLYTFSDEKLKKYIEETNKFIIPLAQYGKAYYPQYANAISILKNTIHSLNNSMNVTISIYDKKIKELEEKLEEQNTIIKKLQKK